MFHCPQCGTAVHEDSSQYCPACGYRFPSGYDRKIRVNYAWEGGESGEMRFSGRMSRPELKQAAKDRLSGNWWQALAVILISYALFSLIASITLGFGVFLLFGPLCLGQAAFFQQIFRQRRAVVCSLFRDFADFGNAFCLGVLHLLLLFAWGLLLVVPGIVKAYSYAMCWYIRNDQPEMSAREAIRTSKEMMQGHKGELFLLDLSFIGFWLLGPAFFVLGTIWTPFLYALGLVELFYAIIYQSAARAAFYENLKASRAHTQVSEMENNI
ncbi:MAG: DUF975 family protein [Firmicutes bacterium]|nr:DUF975 family protein [Bacillota bacterium]